MFAFSYMCLLYCCLFCCTVGWKTYGLCLMFTNWSAKISIAKIKTVAWIAQDLKKTKKIFCFAVCSLSLGPHVSWLSSTPWMPGDLEEWCGLILHLHCLPLTKEAFRPAGFCTALAPGYIDYGHCDPSSHIYSCLRHQQLLPAAPL